MLPPRLLGIGLVGLCAVLGGCSSKAERIDGGLAKAVAFAGSSDWDKAGVELRNVLQIDPKNARAHLVGAQVAEGQRDVQRAFQGYQKAVELDASLLDAKVGLARIYLLDNDLAQARRLAEEVLAIDPAQLGARTVRVALTARDGNPRQAADEARAIIASSKVPPVDASLLLAALHHNEGDAARALQTTDEALKAQPKSLPLLMAAVQVAGDRSVAPDIARRAPDYFRRATALAPRDAQLWNLWAAHHLRRGEVAAAEDVLRAAVKAAPDDAQRVLNLVKLVAQQRGSAAAEKTLRDAIAAQPRAMELRFGLANLYSSMARDPDARKVLQEIIDRAPEAPSALVARTRLAMHRLVAAQPDEARALVAQVLAISPRDNAALVLRGRIRLHEGHARDAVADLRAAARDQPGAPEVIGLLAQAHVAAGEPQLAREALVDAVALRPENADLRLLLAAHLAEARDFKGAQAQVDAAMQGTTDAARLHEFRARLHAAQNDAAGVERSLVAMRDANPMQAAGHLRLGQFYAERKRWDLAQKTFDAGAATLPGEPALAVAAIGVLVEQQRFAAAQQRIDVIAVADPKSALPHRLAGDLALRRGDATGAKAAYLRWVQAVPTSAAAYLSLARAHTAEGDAAGALAALRRGVAAVPDDVKLPSAIGEWMMRAGRHDEAVQAYEAVLLRAPGDDDANNNLAYLLAEIKGDPASLRRALALAGRFAESNNPSYLDSLGWIHHKLGDSAKAVPLLERALALQPGSPTLASHLGLALVKAGDAQRGRALLRKVVDSGAAVANLDELRQVAAGG